MNNYPGIFKIKDMTVDSVKLLKEFEKYSLKHNFISLIKDKGDWTGLCVYDGKGRRTGTTKNLLNEFPELKKVINQIGTKNVDTIWFLNLASGAQLHSHRDTFGNLIFGMMRVHIPIKTNKKSVLTIQKIDIHIPLGEVWSLDTSALHGASNASNHDRIHIVIDVTRGKETVKFFPQFNFSLFIHLLYFCILIIPSKLILGIMTKPERLLRKIFKKQFDS